jgi:hypothetical protein
MEVKQSGTWNRLGSSPRLAPPFASTIRRSSARCSAVQPAGLLLARMAGVGTVVVRFPDSSRNPLDAVP